MTTAPALDVFAASLALIAKWKNAPASELSMAQSFVVDLCELLGLTKPHVTVADFAEGAKVSSVPATGTVRQAGPSSLPDRVCSVALLLTQSSVALPPARARIERLHQHNESVTGWRAWLN